MSENALYRNTANFLRNMPVARTLASYQTPLTPKEESAFQSWVVQNKVPVDLTASSDYDMRGFWKALVTGSGDARQAVSANDGMMHFSDKFKTPYHATFSNESQYALPSAPQWNEQDQLRNLDGSLVIDERRPSLVKR